MNTLTKNHRHHRRLWQFSLRTLLLATTILCIVLGFLSNRLIQVRQEDAAIAKLRSYGAAVTLAYKSDSISPYIIIGYDGSIYLEESKFSVLLDHELYDSVYEGYEFGPPKGLRTAWFGDRRPRAVMVIYDPLELKQIPGGGVSLGLADQPNFSRLDLCDEHLEPLMQLQTLLEVNLGYMHISDEAFVKLAALKNLKILDLRNTWVSREAVNSLQKKLPNCRIITGPYFRPPVYPLRE